MNSETNHFLFLALSDQSLLTSFSCAIFAFGDLYSHGLSAFLSLVFSVKSGEKVSFQTATILLSED